MAFVPTPSPARYGGTGTSMSHWRAGASPTEAPAVRRASPVQGLATAISRQLLIDRHEIWSKWRFSFWRPDADFGLLIGYPFSPVAAAARRLTQRGIGYMMDAGDPWILTHSYHLRRHIALRRSRRAEHHLWSHAAGAIVTTPAAPPSGAFSRTCRLWSAPNGYQPVPEPVIGPPIAAPRVGTRDELRLVRFGRVYAPGVDIGPLMLRLSESKIWRSIVLDLMGMTWREFCSNSHVVWKSRFMTLFRGQRR